MNPAVPSDFQAVLAERKDLFLKGAARSGAVLLLIVFCLWYADFFNPASYIQGAAGVFQIIIPLEKGPPTLQGVAFRIWTYRSTNRTT